MKSKGSFDENLEGHQHFRCVKHKRIVDFYLKPLNNIEAPVSIGEKFTVFRKTIYLEGICGLCRKKSVNKKGCFFARMVII